MLLAWHTLPHSMLWLHVQSMQHCMNGEDCPKTIRVLHLAQNHGHWPNKNFCHGTTQLATLIRLIEAPVCWQSHCVHGDMSS